MNGERRPNKKTVCALLAEMGLSTGRGSKLCVTSVCSWSICELCISQLCVLSAGLTVFSEHDTSAHYNFVCCLQD